MRVRKIAETKVGSSCSVPKAVKFALGVKKGEYIAWYIKDDEVIVKKEEKDE